MGQKVSPIGLRIGVNRDWESKWYAPTKDFAKYLNTDIQIRKYLDKALKGCSVASIVIERNKKRTNVIINTSKPGIVIGKGGADIEKHKKALQKLTGEEIYLSIVEVKNPDMNAALVAENIALQIQNRASFRAVQKRAIRNTMKAGAIGIGAIFIFMIAYYRIPGIIASMALTLYTTLVLFIFSENGVALTLPGIAAFLLTVGMAVDANVLIFERIREELKKVEKEYKNSTLSKIMDLLYSFFPDREIPFNFIE